MVFSQYGGVLIQKSKHYRFVQCRIIPIASFFKRLKNGIVSAVWPIYLAYVLTLGCPKNVNSSQTKKFKKVMAFLNTLGQKGLPKRTWAVSAEVGQSRYRQTSKFPYMS